MRIDVFKNGNFKDSDLKKSTFYNCFFENVYFGTWFEWISFYNCGFKNCTLPVRFPNELDRESERFSRCTFEECTAIYTSIEVKPNEK